MKNTFKILLFCIAIVSCRQSINPADITKLNGYWEIEKVTSPDHEDKDYKVNETIDYFEIKNNSGVRHKVTPQFNGTYLVNEYAENFKIVNKDDKTYLTYFTKFATWSDELVSISADKFVVKNTANNEYHYKKPIPFSVK